MQTIWYKLVLGMYFVLASYYKVVLGSMLCKSCSPKIVLGRDCVEAV